MSHFNRGRGYSNRPSGSGRIDNRHQGGNFRRGGGIQPRVGRRDTSDENLRRQVRVALEVAGGVPLRRSIDNRQSNEEWTTWQVFLGAKYDRGAIISLIQSAVPFPLVPFNAQNDPKRNLIFYCKLTRAQMATARSSVQGMKDPADRELVIHIFPTKLPNIPNMDEPYVQEKLKLALQQRYNPATQHIDLSALNQDSVLKAAQLFIPLNRNVIIDFICEALMENLYELRSINLSDNIMANIDAFKNFFSKFNMIRQVDLSKNRLTRVDDLKPLLPCAPVLVALDLSDNVLMQTRPALTKSLLLKMFPALKKFGSQDVNSEPQFEIEQHRILSHQAKRIPPSVKAYFPSAALQAPFMTFIAEYLTKFDTNRRELLDYYTPTSLFTLHCGTHPLFPPESKRLDNDMYHLHNRNLHHIKDVHRRKSAIKNGNIQIVGFLEGLPATRHHMVDDGTFSVEVAFQSASFMILHFNGLYNELPGSGQSIPRAYSCSMIIVPPMLLLNHDLLVTNPTADMIRKMKSSQEPAPAMPTAMSVGPQSQMSTAMSVGPQSQMSTAMSVGPPLQQEVSNPVVQDSLVRQLMDATSMNEIFARKCLVEFSWKYDAALQKFLELRAAGMIPPDAFVH